MGQGAAREQPCTHMGGAHRQILKRCECNANVEYVSPWNNQYTQNRESLLNVEGCFLTDTVATHTHTKKVLLFITIKRRQDKREDEHSSVFPRAGGRLRVERDRHKETTLHSPPSTGWYRAVQPHVPPHGFIHHSKYACNNVYICVILYKAISLS